jgi:tetratricopeptide (TPR) repeat protein
MCIRCEADDDETVCSQCRDELFKDNPLWLYPYLASGPGLIHSLSQEALLSSDGTVVLQQSSNNLRESIDNLKLKDKERKAKYLDYFNRLLLQMGVPLELDIHDPIVLTAEDNEVVGAIFKKTESDALRTDRELCLRLGNVLWHYGNMLNNNGRKASRVKAKEIFEQALGLFRKAHSIEADSTSHKSLGVTLHSLEEHETSLEPLEELGEVDDYQVYLIKGLDLQAIDKIDEAFENMNKAIELNPKPIMLIEMGKFLISIDVTDEAFKLLDEAMQSEETLEEALQLKYDLLVKLKRKEEAKECLSKLDEIRVTPISELRLEGLMPELDHEERIIIKPAEKGKLEVAKEEYSEEWHKFKRWMSEEINALHKLKEDLERRDKKLLEREAKIHELETKRAEKLIKEAALPLPKPKAKVPEPEPEVEIKEPDKKPKEEPVEEPKKESQVEPKKEIIEEPKEEAKEMLPGLPVEAIPPVPEAIEKEPDIPAVKEKPESIERPKPEPVPEPVPKRPELIEETDRIFDIWQEITIRAKHYNESRKFKEALYCYDAATRLSPAHGETLLGKAQVLENLERFDEALQILDRVLDLNEDDVMGWKQKIALLQKLGRFDEALEAYQELMPLVSDKESLDNERGKLLMNLGKFDEAALCFNSIIEKDPDNIDAHLNLGDILLNLKQYDEAYQCFNKVAELDPKNSGAWYRRGLIQDRWGRWGAAIQFFNWAIALKDSYSEAWMSKGDVLKVHGDLKDALYSYQKVTALEPENEEAWYNRARVHWELGQHDEAMKCVDTLLVMSPKSKSAIELKASVVEKLKEKKDEAAKDEEYLMENGLVLMKDGKGKDTLKILTLVTKLNPKNEAALMKMAEILTEDGKFKRAARKYDSLLEINSKNKAALMGKAKVSMELSNHEEALMSLDALLKINPKDEKAKELRNECLKKIKEHKK